MVLVLLDLSAAFDTVDHRLLLDKLHEIGIRDNAHRWIQSYLSQRTQAVKVDNVTSRSVGLCSGVPHGSVLGPLFLQSIVWGSTMSSNTTNSVTTCMLTIPSCMLNFRVISQRMLQLPLIAYRSYRYAVSARWHTVTFAALQLSENAFPPLLAKQLFML